MAFRHKGVVNVGFVFEKKRFVRADSNFPTERGNVTRASRRCFYLFKCQKSRPARHPRLRTDMQTSDRKSAMESRAAEGKVLILEAQIAGIEVPTGFDPPCFVSGLDDTTAVRRVETPAAGRIARSTMSSSKRLRNIDLSKIIICRGLSKPLLSRRLVFRA
jgi:hypothetical protein